MITREPIPVTPVTTMVTYLPNWVEHISEGAV